MDKKEVELETKVTLLVYNLAIKPDVIGMKHEFPYKGAMVTISLPVEEQIEAWAGQVDIPAASPGFWHAIEGSPDVPASLDIHRVYVTVRQGNRFSFDPIVFTEPVNAYQHMSDSEQEGITRLADEGKSIASNAFEYWLTVLRWVGGDYRIGRRHVESKIAGFSMLHDVETGRKVWGSAGPLKFLAYQALTVDQWLHVGALLKVEESVPIYVALLQDAEDYQDRKEYRRAMIDIAIACEVFLRSHVLRTLPDSLDQDITTMIESANISQFARKFFVNQLRDDAKADYKPFIKEIDSLFDARNKIMHMANDERATDETCTRFIAMAKKLFNFSSRVRLD